MRPEDTEPDPASINTSPPDDSPDPERSESAPPFPNAELPTAIAIEEPLSRVEAPDASKTEPPAPDPDWPATIEILPALPMAVEPEDNATSPVFPANDEEPVDSDKVPDVPLPTDPVVTTTTPEFPDDAARADARVTFPDVESIAPGPDCNARAPPDKVDEIPADTVTSLPIKELLPANMLILPAELVTELPDAMDT
jgi:hypothetical protein